MSIRTLCQLPQEMLDQIFLHLAPLGVCCLTLCSSSLSAITDSSIVWEAWLARDFNVVAGPERSQPSPGWMTARMHYRAAYLERQAIKQADAALKAAAEDYVNDRLQNWYAHVDMKNDE